MNPPLIEVRDLKIEMTLPDGRFRTIVSDISFEIPKGEVLALIGESGSGKTTIALSLMGHSRFGGRITAEMIRVGGHRIDQLDERGLASLRGHRISYIAQSAAAAFNPSRTIMAQVIEPLLVHRLAGRKEAESRAIELFRSLALPSPDTIGSRYPHQVSGGQLQRLMAAMALITRPELVILDEPTTALDVTTQVEVLNTFKHAVAEVGATAIYVSHDLAVVAQVANRILVLKDGRMCESGSAETILEHAADDYTRTLIAAANPAQMPASSASGPVKLQVRGVIAGYGKITGGCPAIPVLSDISLTVERGATLGVIGESGSGKSTLARVIAGLLPAASGSIELDGRELAPAMSKRTREDLRRIQFVFQNADTALNPAHTVGETVARPLAFYHGIKGQAAQLRVAELLDLIRLPRDLAARRSHELSGGQKQRVNLARALAAEPEVLICDEVTSALDTVVGQAILKLIDDLRRSLGIATVFISHDISTVHAFCDRLLVLYSGTAVESADRADFEGPAHHPYTQLLVSSVPKMDRDWLEGRAKLPGAIMPGAIPGPQLCRFLPRCPMAVRGLCDTAPPPGRSNGSLNVLCHLSIEDLTMQAIPA